VKHDEPGIVSMANNGHNTNGGQFFITLGKAPHLDGKHVAFGKVVEGFEIIEQIQEEGISSGAPLKTITISDYGKD
jgi:peptidylprolyl isomerase